MTTNVVIQVKAPEGKVVEVKRFEDGAEPLVIGRLKGMTFDEYCLYDGVRIELTEQEEK